MINTVGIILTGSNSNRLMELTQKRASAAIPVGGKYRAIDFVLSNMVNSGIVSVAVLTQYNFRSLMDHLGSGKEWDMDRKQKGLFIFPPYLSNVESNWYKGSADALYSNLSFLKRSTEEYAIIAQGNCVYKENYQNMLKYHIEKNADITIAYREMTDYSQEELSLLGIVNVDEDGKINDFYEKPLHPNSLNGSMGIYILRRELLISLIEESEAHGKYDLVKDVIIKKVNCLNLYGYKYEGYWRNISSVPLYYRCNMEMLNPDIRRELFYEKGKVYTKVKDEAPAKYNIEAEVKNSIIADGCIIEGTVENSVLFRGVTVKKGVVIKNSIVMQDSVVEENSKLEYTIVDKNVRITPEKYIKGDLKWPVIISKGVVV